MTSSPVELEAESVSRCSHCSSIAGAREPANLKYTGRVGVIQIELRPSPIASESSQDTINGSLRRNRWMTTICR